MSYMKFICEHTDWNSETMLTRTTVESNNVVLEDVLRDFEDFLRGAGFHIQGHLGFISDEEEIEESEPNDRWGHVVDSLMNPPKFRASESVQVCGICRLTGEELAGHRCWDKNCPLDGNTNNAN
jgi:hypothetical protein